MKTTLSFLIILFSFSAFASNSGVTYQGRILKPDGSPLAGQFTQFKMQIRTPDSGSCLMYEEIQSQDLRNSDGVFSLTINDGNGSRTDGTGLTLDRIFANRGSFTLNAASCNAGSGVYAPGQNDGRDLVVLFKDETMASWEPIPAQKINFVPLAFEAKQVAGFTADSLLRVVNGSGDPLTGLAPLSNAQYTELMALVNGTSNAFTKANQLGGVALPPMTSGEVLGWNGSAWVSQPAVAGANSVTTAMIQNNAVDSSKIANGAVGSSQIASNVSINTSGTVASAITTTRDFKIYAASPSTFNIDMQAPALAASYSLVWPMDDGNNGEVLTTNGSGVLSWAPAAPASQWTTHAPNVSYDGGGNVGIGTTSPTSNLSFSGQADQTIALERTTGGAAGSSLTIGAAGATSGGTDLAGGNLVLQTGTSTGNARNSVQFKLPTSTNVSGTSDVTPATKMTLTTHVNNGQGLLGVNVAAPTTILDLFGTATSATSGQLALHSGSSAGQFTGINFIANSTQSAGLSASQAGSIYAKVTQASPLQTDFALLNNTGDTINPFLYALGTNGNVGIGTTSPSAKLDVSGTVNATGFTLNGTPLAAGGPSQSGTAGFVFNSNSDATGSDGGFSFQSGGTNLVNITDAGNVGIGTSAPTNKLDVIGGATIGYTGGTAAPTNGLLVGGKLGIGDSYFSNGSPTVPQGDLHISNASGSTSFIMGRSSSWQMKMATNSGGFLTVDGGNNGFGELHKPQDGGFTIDMRTAPSIFDVKSNGTSVMRVNYAGNVGIGTTSPSGTLHVVGGTSVSGQPTSPIILKAQDSGGGAVIGGRIDLIPGAGTTGQPGGNVNVNLDQGGVFAITKQRYAPYTANSGSMPSEHFMFESGWSYDNQSSLMKWHLKNQAVVDKLAWMGAIADPSGSSEPTFIYAAGSSSTERLRIAPGGNVGIGTTSPSTKLDVQGIIRSVGAGGTTYSNSSATVDWSNGNNQIMTSACTTTSFTNMADGATYNLLVTDTTATTCVFSQAGLTFTYAPANAARESGKMSLYSFTRFANYVVVGWTPLN